MSSSANGWSARPDRLQSFQIQQIDTVGEGLVPSLFTFLKVYSTVMLLSCSAKKVTKECGIGEALRKCALPYVPHQPHRRPVSKNVPIFEHLPRKIRQVFSLQTPENRNIFGSRRAMRRRGFLRGHAFSKCPLKSPSFGTFLGEARKVYYALPDYRNVYLFEDGDLLQLKKTKLPKTEG